MVNETSKLAYITLCNNLFGNFAVLIDEDMVQSANYLSDGETDARTRCLPVEVVHFVIDHCGALMARLITHDKFRERLIGIIDYEKNRMESNQFNHLWMDIPNSITIDLSTYDDEAYKRLCGQLKRGVNEIMPFSDYYDYELNLLSFDDKILIGYIVNNMYYLIRALADMDTFFDWLKSVVPVELHYLEMKPKYPVTLTEEELEILEEMGNVE